MTYGTLSVANAYYYFFFERSDMACNDLCNCNTNHIFNTSYDKYDTLNRYFLSYVFYAIKLKIKVHAFALVVHQQLPLRFFVM